MKKKINLARAYVVRAKGITRAVLKRHGMTNAATGKVIHVAPATIGRWLDDQTPTFFDLEHAAAICIHLGIPLSLICCHPVTGWSETSTKPTITSAGIN